MSFVMPKFALKTFSIQLMSLDFDVALAQITDNEVFKLEFSNKLIYH
jgi:hypothetical protein